METKKSTLLLSFLASAWFSHAQIVEPTLTAKIAQAQSYLENSIATTEQMNALETAITMAEIEVAGENEASAMEALETSMFAFATSGAMPVNGLCFDVTKRIADADCGYIGAKMGAWKGGCRTWGSAGQHWRGTNVTDAAKCMFTGWDGANYYQTLTALPAGGYDLKSAVRTVTGDETLVCYVGGTLYYTHRGKYSRTGGTIATDGTEWANVKTGIEAGKTFANDNKGFGWVYRSAQFVLEKAADTNIKFTMSKYSGGTSATSQEADLGGCNLFFYGNGVTVNENEDYVNPVAKCPFATITRRFNDGVWNTLVLPFDLTKEQIATVFGTEAIVAHYTGSSGNGDGSYILNFSTAIEGIKAFEPVFIYGATSLDGVMLKGFTPLQKPASTTVSDPNGIIDFIGFTDKENTLQNGDFFISTDNNFYKATGTEVAAGMRGVFRLKDGASSKAINGFCIDGATTGVGTIQPALKEGACYTINGIKTEVPLKGLYIRDGKKFIKKN